MQSSLLQAYEGKKWDEPGGLDCLGRAPLYRAYQARDGWVFMAALGQDISECPELADLAGLRDSALERALEARFRERAVDEWVKLLREADIAAQRVILRFEDLMKDPVVIRQGLSLTRLHDKQGMVTTTGPGIRLSRTPMSPRRPAPMPGTDAESILSEVGMAGELERLKALGVLVTEGVEPGGAS
jgi:crotonobetainyl-CoA:carnitine CoA-transferase CaiB-like acyl-CoA transferase